MLAQLPLRRRFIGATAALVVSQIATSGLALASWRYALVSVDRQQALAEDRVAVTALGSAVREQYVHQAHTYIEGGPGHLHHGGEAAKAVRDRLDRLDAMNLPTADHAVLVDIRADQGALEDWFDTRVAPLAMARTLDRAHAADLHAGTHRLTDATTHRIDALLVDLDDAASAEQSRAARATTGAVIAPLLFTGFGLAVVLFIRRSLANAVLAPVDAIRAAAADWQPGARPDGADELGEISAAFDAIVARLGDAEARRLDEARLVALGEMSAAAAHELRNPLTAILGQLRHVDNTECAPIRAEAEHARRIVDGLLGFARPIEQPASLVDVAESARQAIDRSIMAADPRNVEIRLTHADPVLLVAAASGVRQILDNLLSNAIEVAPAGSTVEIEVRDGPFRVEVRDRGLGIPAKVRERLYEPFVTGRATGTGLGLAVCQPIARALGTAISHVDRAGGGTVAVWIMGAEGG